MRSFSVLLLILFRGAVYPSMHWVRGRGGGRCFSSVLQGHWFPLMIKKKNIKINLFCIREREKNTFKLESRGFPRRT